MQSYESGLNIHACIGDGLKEVDRNSAGCQVSEFMSVHNAGLAMHKESMNIKKPISYLLTTVDDWSGFLNLPKSEVRQWIMNLKD